MRRVSHVGCGSRAATMQSLFGYWTTMSEAQSSRRRMKGGAEPEVQTLRGSRCSEAKRVPWLFACLLLASLFLFVVVHLSPAVSAVRNTSTPNSARVNIPTADYSKFSHS